MSRSLAKKVRFDVFKRDGFVCQYCGAHPPSVVLEVDHIIPVSRGGSNDPDNLITSCLDCNRGKGAASLSVAPLAVSEKTAIIREREEQLKEYEGVLRDKAKRENRAIKKVEAVLWDQWGQRFSDSFKESIRRNFLPHFTHNQLAESLERACIKTSTPNDALKYFCGICWCMIREGKK